MVVSVMTPESSPFVSFGDVFQEKKSSFSASGETTEMTETETEPATLAS